MSEAVLRDSGKAGGSYHWDVYGIADLFPPAAQGRDVLLLGCGDGGERPYLDERGFRCIGLDIRTSPGTDLVGDAHALPLPDESLDIILSMQVLEHLHSPWIAMDEVARVLRPGGWFIGSVAFLKPYHASYFHMSHEGVRILMNRSGLTVDTVKGAQSLTYTLLGSILPLGSRPLRRLALNWVDRAFLGARALFWSLTRRLSSRAPTDRFDEELRLSFATFDKLRFAPAVVFRGRKTA